MRRSGTGSSCPTPRDWGWGKQAHLLVGALAHSGRWRAVLCESEDQPHLIDAMDRVVRALGGLTIGWRFDRMATVISTDTGRVSASFAAVAKHYGVMVRPCPPRRGNRKGVVEKANHVAAQRFWRTVPDDATVEAAQSLLDRWCSLRGDARVRATADGKSTVATVAAAEPLRPAPPVPFPATLVVTRKVSAQGLVSFRGNRYSVPPELGGARPGSLLAGPSRPRSSDGGCFARVGRVSRIASSLPMTRVAGAPAGPGSRGGSGRLSISRVLLTRSAQRQCGRLWPCEPRFLRWRALVAHGPWRVSCGLSAD